MTFFVRRARLKGAFSLRWDIIVVKSFGSVAQTEPSSPYFSYLRKIRMVGSWQRRFTDVQAGQPPVFSFLY